MGKRNFKHTFSKAQRRNGRTPKTRPDGDQKKASIPPKGRLQENEVGISEYLNKSSGFTGIIKSRFSDFHVNEIDLSGKILELTDLNIPRAIVEASNAEESDILQQRLKEFLSSEQCARISELAAETCQVSGGEQQPIDINISHLDKEARTQIHQSIKKLFAGKLISTTISLEPEAADNSKMDGNEKISKGSRFLRVLKSKPGRHGDNRWAFPGQYTHFLLHKENMDTSEVACAMAKRLNLRPSQVNYCGTKDKRAKTTQKFCIKHRNPSQIVNSVKLLQNVYVGNFEFKNEVLKLGDLQGNRFRIALRHICEEQDEIKIILEKVRENGFINYFGLQRFGNCASVPTYEIGLALLKGEYKLACEMILKPRENDAPFMQAIRAAWWKDRDSKAAASMFYSDKYIEKRLLDGLAEYGENDYSSALRKIPRNMLTLYIHAFQSLIFNKVASRRIKEFGVNIIPGDLVYRSKEELDEDLIEDLSNEMEHAEEDSFSTDSNTLPEASNERVDKIASVEVESIFKRKVKPLTEEDISSGQYTLFDVVLPLPGYDVTYPGNVTGEWYKELLAEYDLSSEKLRSNVKTYTLSGLYRKLIIQPTEMSWRFCTYKSNESTLILSDWEVLKNQDAPLTADPANDKYKALILEFRLPPSAYATMMLRELLRSDTSATHQAQLQQKALEARFNEQEMSTLEQQTAAKKRSAEDEQLDGKAKLVKLA